MPAYPKTKPSRNAKINLRHPWSKKIVNFWACNDLSGNNVFDLVNNFTLTVQSGTPWDTNLYGSGLKFSSSGVYAKATVPSQYRLGWPVTGAYGMRVLGVGSTNDREYCVTYDNSVGTPFICYGINRTNANALLLRWNNAGTFGQFTGQTLTTGNDYVVSFTISASQQIVYVNGLNPVSQSNSISNCTFGTAPQMCLGEVQSENPNVFFYWGLIANIAWPASQHIAIGSNVNNIWQMFQPDQPSLGLPSLAGWSGRLAGRGGGLTGSPLAGRSGLVA